MLCYYLQISAMSSQSPMIAKPEEASVPLEYSWFGPTAKDGGKLPEKLEWNLPKPNENGILCLYVGMSNMEVLGDKYDYFKGHILEASVRLV